MPTTAPIADPRPCLSKRELAVLRHMISNASAPGRVMAAELGICEAAVRVHMTRLFRKLGVKNRMEAVAAAKQHGINQWMNA